MDPTHYLANQAFKTTMNGNARPQDVDAFYETHAASEIRALKNFCKAVAKGWRSIDFGRGKPIDFAPIPKRG